jgi:hypothetical protein
MKRTLPLLIASITGFLLIGAFFVPFTKSWGEEVLAWFDIVAAFAFVLGAGNILKMHLSKISDQRPGWGYSVVTVAAFAATLIVGLAKVGVHPSESYPENPYSGSYLQEGGAFWWIYQYLFLPLSATMFAMLAFYIASAAFRAFRAKNTEAIILLGTAFIILLGRTYAGTVLTSPLPEWLSALRVENLTVWIMATFNLAGNRAIMIGIGLGIVSTSLKVLLGVDRSYLGQE